MGLPEELLPLAIGVNLLLEFPMTAVNLTCLQSELVLASAQLGMLDGEPLRSANPQKTGPLRRGPVQAETISAAPRRPDFQRHGGDT